MDYYVDVVEVNNCRVCNDVDAVLNIFTDLLEGEGVLLHEALEFITCLKVDLDDGTSKNMCGACSTRLLDAYRFKNQALDSYKILEDNRYIIYERDCELESNMVVIETEDSTLELPKSMSESTAKSEVDTSTDAVSFLIEHHLKTSTQEEVLTEEEQQGTVEDAIVKPRLRVKLKYECEICNKRFRKKSNLIDHLRLHANEKKFVCSFCDKSFVQVANFRMHERIHTKERPFECPICMKAYNQSSTLKIHIRSHTQERNYICSICSKAFTNSSDLNKHKRVHDPSKHFKCEFCGRSFAQKVNMRAHQRKAHAKEVNS